MASILIDTYYISGFVYCPARYSIRCVSHLESEHMVCRPPPTPFFAATKHPSLEQLAGIFRLLRNFRDNLTLQHTATFAPLSPPSKKKRGIKHLKTFVFIWYPLQPEWCEGFVKLGELLPGRGLIAKLPAAPEAHCGFAAGIPLFLHAV